MKSYVLSLESKSSMKDLTFALSFASGGITVKIADFGF